MPDHEDPEQTQAILLDLLDPYVVSTVSNNPLRRLSFPLSRNAGHIKYCAEQITEDPFWMKNMRLRRRKGCLPTLMSILNKMCVTLAG
jgi:hypothetical protein